MYHHLCLLFILICYSLIIAGIVISNYRAYFLSFGLVGMIGYPILLEALINLKALIFNSTTSSDNHVCHHNRIIDKIPIIYSEDYNITACGIEKCHPFDSKKYGKIYNYLLNKKLIDGNFIHHPELPTRELLNEVMGKWHLFLLNYSLYISKCVEIPLLVPSEFLRYRLLNPMMKATQGSVDAACIALHSGWAINLAGGYHHATRNSGGGFCIYPDITFVIHYLRKWHSNQVKKVLIIDLDAHQGNGHERDSLGDENTFIMDVFNNHIYPGDNYAKSAISEEIHVSFRDSDKDYLDHVREGLLESLKKFQPDFIIYNAGTDCLQGDPLGNLNLSNIGVIMRDELVFEKAFQSKIPILMVLSGGYQQINAQVIGESIESLFKKFNLAEQTKLIY